jgi:hypothetical protein
MRLRETPGRFWLFVFGPLVGFGVAFWSVPVGQVIVYASIVVAFGLAFADAGWWPAQHPEVSGVTTTCPDCGWARSLCCCGDDHE